MKPLRLAGRRHEHRAEARQRDYSLDSWRRPNHAQPSALKLSAAAGCQQCVDPRAVDERDASEVEGEPGAVPPDDVQQLIPQLRAGIDVDLSADCHDRAGADTYVQGRRLRAASAFASHISTIRRVTCPANPANS
jgi:hypothetical protein